ncbi:uncharacterized protein LOC144018777 [Festucalex cinctus]
MPSKRKKNQRRMRRVQAQRRALEERNSCGSPAIIAHKEQKTKRSAKVQPEPQAQVGPAVPEPVPIEKKHGEANPKPPAMSQVKVLARELVAEASEPAVSAAALEPKPKQTARQGVEPESTQQVVSNAPRPETVTEETKSGKQVVTSRTFNPQPITETQPAAKGEPKADPDVKVKPDLVGGVIASVPKLVRCTFNPEPVIKAESVVQVEPQSIQRVAASRPQPITGTQPAAKGEPKADPDVKVKPDLVGGVIASVPKLVRCTFNPEPVIKAESVVQVEPQSIQRVAASRPQPITGTQPAAKREPKADPAVKVEADLVEKVIASGPKLVRCTFNPEPVIKAESVVQVEPQSIQRVAASRPQPITGTQPAAKREPKADPAVKVEADLVEKVIASGPKLVRCTFNPEPVIKAEPVVQVERVAASGPQPVNCTIDPEPAQVAIQKVVGEVVCCTFDPQPVVEAELAVKVESESVEQVVTSLPKVISCTRDPELAEPSAANEREQVKPKKIPEAKPKEKPEPEPVAGGQTVGCSLNPEPVAVAAEAVQVTHVQKPEHEVAQAEPEPKAASEPVAVKDGAAASLKCPSEGSSTSSRQMHAGSTKEIALEAALKGHIVPEVSIEG